ncbi:MAG TPA: PD-(D/E)XK nuclease family protein [Acidimicrobiales bacterium]|nr:PD-(D/E)XK nuclease family protein [Acidimicrobiales bacterium]
MRNVLPAQLVALGPEAVRLLRQALASAKAQDPLAPVTVVVPSNYAGLSLRRLLAREAPGVANVRFLSLPRLAELLAAPRLAASGRRPVTPALAAHAVRRALAADPGVFKAVAHHPATERALTRAYRDLRPCSPRALGAVGRQSERAADVVRLVGQARAGLEAGWYDEQDVLEAAVAAAGAGGGEPGGELGPVVAFCLGPVDAAGRRLLDVFGAGLTTIEGTVARDRPPPVDLVLTAPDPDEEVRAVLREVMARLARGAPLHRMAVLYPAADPYAVLTTQQLDAAGIPYNGPPVTRLRDTVAGRALLGLLRLPERGWRRDDVTTWLASAPVLDGGRLVPASRWDAVSRAAGVIEGADQWQQRLAAYAGVLAERLALDPEPTDERRWEEVQIEQAEEARRFVADLVAAAQPPPGAGWAALARWAVALLERYLGADATHALWPEGERDAWQHVVAAVHGLAPLDRLGGPTAPGTFLRALDHELDAHVPRMGTFGDGLFVAPLAHARALDFDTVFVLGLAEGTLPGGAQDDALLPDVERRAADGELALVGAGRDDDHVALLAALAAGRERVLSWAQADGSGQGRARLPSRWLVEALAVPEPERPAQRSVPSFEAGLATPGGEPATLADYDLAGLAAWCRTGGRPEAHFLAAEDRRLAAGFEAVAARQSSRFTRFDGYVGGRSGAASALAGILSPTSLEVYATCPLRYFLRQVLRVTPTEKPEEIVRLSPMEKGSLVHRVLEAYLLAVLAGEPRSLDRLLAIAEAAFADVERRGLTGKQRTWQYEQELIRRELRRFFEDDTLTPLAAELTFGMGGEEPVVVTLDGGHEVRFRGAADRVDRDERGRLVVTDYKTGSLADYEDLRRNLPADPVDRGRKLQLPLYALAAAQRYGGDGGDGGGEEAAAARYWFTSERGRFETIGYEVDERVLARFRAVVGTIVAGVGAGAFPARPGPADRGSYRNCRWCDFDSLCAQDRGRAWERKREAPVLAGYVELAEGEQ